MRGQAGELFNEPFPGDVFGDARNRNNTYADRYNLQPWYSKIARNIRTVLPQEVFNIAYEPSWPIGDQDVNPDDILFGNSGFSELPEPNSIYAFHYYSAPWCVGLNFVVSTIVFLLFFNVLAYTRRTI